MTLDPDNIKQISSTETVPVHIVGAAGQAALETTVIEPPLPSFTPGADSSKSLQQMQNLQAADQAARAAGRVAPNFFVPPDQN